MKKQYSDQLQFYIIGKTTGKTTLVCSRVNNISSSVLGTFRELVDINFVSSMGPPGGGRNPVTPRFLRHFNHLSFTELEDESKHRIFATILKSWIGKAFHCISSMGSSEKGLLDNAFSGKTRGTKNVLLMEILTHSLTGSIYSLIHSFLILFKQGY